VAPHEVRRRVRGSRRRHHTIGRPPNAYAISQRRCAANLPTLRRRCGDCSATDALALFKFPRQVPFQNFILDFVCFEKRMIIEVDGSQHASSERDGARDAVLMAEGFRIERYWNNDVLLQPSAVLEDILAKLAKP
jgi:very-short-patch-repair endonuclease